MKHQLTGNAGLYHVARELSRFGWHVMPTVRNARGADLYAAKGEDGIAIPIQSKALSKKAPVPLGTDLNKLRTHWWIITIHANTAAPTCYVMSLNEVRDGAHRGESKAGVTYWLQPRAYALPAYHEAWHRLSDPSA
ncbi:PD(D/E)XK endonuclease domain-containing protein [Methylorubrum aminovorans]